MFATGTYPFLSKVKPEDFVRALAISEIALGAALVIPVIPSAVVGAALTAFSGGLLGLYVGRILREVQNRPRYVIKSFENIPGETSDRTPSC